MGGRHADPKLLEAARRLAPVIRQYNEEAERERRLCPPLLAALHEAGLLPRLPLIALPIRDQIFGGRLGNRQNRLRNLLTLTQRGRGSV